MGTNNFTPRYLNPRELKTYVHTKTYTKMFIAALFRRAEQQNHPKYPSIGRGITKQNVVYSPRNITQP